MTGSEQKLRRINEKTLAEVELPSDGKRPLEWRRGFNRLHFRVRDLRPCTHYVVHDDDHELDSFERYGHWSWLKSPAVKMLYVVEGAVDESVQRDTLSRVVNAGEELLVVAKRVPRKVKVFLRGGPPENGNDKIPDGVFHGALFQDTSREGPDDLCLEATIYPEQIIALHEALKANPSLEISLSTRILSYSNELDDALREPFHPRTLLVDDFADAAVCSISLLPNSAGDDSTSEAEKQPGMLAPGGSPTSEDSETALGRALPAIVRDLAALSRATKGVAVALWATLVVVVLAAIF